MQGDPELIRIAETYMAPEGAAPAPEEEIAPELPPPEEPAAAGAELPSPLLEEPAVVGPAP
jgi:hypothetical protein